MSTATPPPVGWIWHSEHGQLDGYRFDPPVPLAALKELPSNFGGTRVNGVLTSVYGYYSDSRVQGPGNNFVIGAARRGVILTGTSGSRCIQTTIPYRNVFWLSAIGLIPAVLSASNWVHLRRLPRVSLCLQCGYDLRASPDRCPECGTTPAAAAAAAGPAGSSTSG
jgi:hypothetical protein